MTETLEQLATRLGVRLSSAAPEAAPSAVPLPRRRSTTSGVGRGVGGGRPRKTPCSHGDSDRRPKKVMTSAGNLCVTSYCAACRRTGRPRGRPRKVAA